MPFPTFTLLCQVLLKVLLLTRLSLVLVALCWPQKDADLFALLVVEPLLSSSLCCETCLSGLTFGTSNAAAWRHDAFTSGDYQVTCQKGWLFVRSCGCHCFGTQRFHNSSLPREVISIPPLVLWTESITMQGHYSADSGVLPLSL